MDFFPQLTVNTNLSKGETEEPSGLVEAILSTLLHV